METEPELSKFEVNEQTDPPPDLHTLKLTASYTHVFLSIRILHISYTIYFHEIVQDPERLYPIQITFSVQTKQKARFGNIPRNLLVNKSSIQLIWSAPDCDCCICTSPNKPKKGRNLDVRCRVEDKLKPTRTKEKRELQKKTPFQSDSVFQNGV